MRRTNPTRRAGATAPERPLSPAGAPTRSRCPRLGVMCEPSGDAMGTRRNGPKFYSLARVVFCPTYGGKLTGTRPNATLPYVTLLVRVVSEDPRRIGYASSR